MKTCVPMKKTPIYILAFLMELICFSCNKSPSASNNLPPISQTGANTFGCKINGLNWVPYYQCDSYCMGCIELSSDLSPEDSTGIFPFRFSLTAGRSVAPFSGFFEFSPFSNGGTSLNLDYIYGTGNVFDSLEIVFFNPVRYTPNYGDPANIFQITKLDSVNRIVSGIFSFVLYSPTDSIVITEGRFDLKMGQYEHCSN
jgi:hypothetical protein